MTTVCPVLGRVSHGSCVPNTKREAKKRDRLQEIEFTEVDDDALAQGLACPCAVHKERMLTVSSVYPPGVRGVTVLSLHTAVGYTACKLVQRCVQTAAGQAAGGKGSRSGVPMEKLLLPP